MSDFLPPVLLELRSNATQFMASMKEAQGALAETDAAGEATASKASKVGSAFSKFSTIAATATAGAAAAIGVESIKMAADFQKQMTLLQTAGGETKQSIQVVAAGIKSLAVSTGTSLDQLSEGMYTVDKAGFRGAEGLNVLKTAAQGAKAEGVDLGTATNALTSVMMSYHLSASQATTAENELIRGSALAKTSMQNFAGSLSTVIPIASAAGIKFPQVAAAIATLTQHGTSADEATQELANTIRNLQAPNQVAQKAMQQLGLSVTGLETHLGSRGLTGTIDVITNAIKNKMGPSGLVAVDAFKKSQSASADLNVELAKMPPSLQQLSKQFEDGTVSYKEYYTAAKDLGGQQYEMAKGFISTMNAAKGFNNLLTSGQPAAQTFAAYLKQVMGGATGLNTALMLGGENMKYFRNAEDQVTKAGADKSVTGFAQSMQTLSAQLSQVKQQVEVVAVNIGTALIPYVQKAISFLQQHKTVVKDVAIGLAALATALTVVKVAMIAVNIVMEANPFVLIATAVVGLGVALVALYEKSQTFRDIVQQVWHDVAAAFDFAKQHAELIGAALIVLTGPIGAVVGAAILLAKNWTTVFNTIKSITGSVVSWVQQQMQVFTSFWNSHSQQIKEIAHVAWVAISTYVKVAIDVIKAVVVPALTLIRSAFKTAFDAAKTIVSTALHVIADTIGTEIKVGMDAIGLIIDLLTGKWGKAWKDGKKLVSDAIHGITSIISDFAHGAIKLLYQAGRDVVQGLINGVKSMIGSIGSAFKSLGGHIVSGIKGVLGIHSPSKVMHDEVGVQIVAGLANGITDSVDLAVNAVVKLGAALTSAAKQVASQVAAALRPTPTNLNVLSSQFGGAFGTATSAQAKSNTAAATLARITKEGDARIAAAKATYAKAVKAYDDYENQLQAAGNKRRTADQNAEIAHLRAVKQAADKNLQTVESSVSKSEAAAKKSAQSAAAAAKAATQKAVQAAQALVNQLQQNVQTMLGNIQSFQATIQQGLTGDDSIATLWGGLTDAVTTAANNLQSAQQNVTSAQDELNQALQSGDPEQIAQAYQDLAAANQAAADAQTAYNTAVSNASTSGLQNSLNQVLAGAQQFAGDLQALANAGASQDLLSQIAGMGPTTGDQLAKQLLAAGSGSIKQMSDTMSSISQYVTGVSQDLSQSYFGQGAQSMQTFIQGLVSQFPELKKALAPISKEIAQALGLPVPTLSVPKSNTNGKVKNKPSKPKQTHPSKADYQAEWAKAEKRAKSLEKKLDDLHAKTHEDATVQEKRLDAVIETLSKHSSRNHTDLATLDRDLSQLGADIARAQLVASRTGAKGKK